MEQIIIFCIELFIIDILVWLLIKNICRLSIRFFEFFCSMFVSIASLSSMFFITSAFYLIIIRLFSAIILSLLITDSYKFSRVMLLNSLYLIFALSCYGYYNFLLLILKSLNLEILNENYLNLYFSCGFLLFYFILYLVSKLIVSSKKSAEIYADVSFFIASKHIRLKGLIDSGNSVYDTKTHLPIIFLSMNSLKRVLPQISPSYVSDILASHYEKCELVGGKTIYVPIVSVDDCKIFKSGECLFSKFEVGIISQTFYDEKHFECLLHRDFL